MLAAMIVQIIVAFWSFPASTHATLPPGVTGCYIGPKKLSDVGRIASLFVMLLVLDTIIFGLTAFHVLRSKHSVPGITTPLTEIMIRDGFLYFSVIFFVNLANVILIELSPIPEDLRPINVEFTPAITTIMVSRLFLNMRRQATAPIYKGAHPRLTATLLGDLDDTVWTPKSENFTLPTEMTNEIELQTHLPKVEDKPIVLCLSI